MASYWDTRRSDPKGQHLILAIEPNGAPPGQALSRALRSWDALREVIFATRDFRCEICGSNDPYLEVHEIWHHTDEKTLLDHHLNLICWGCHVVKGFIWMNRKLPKAEERMRQHFCMVNGVDEKEFYRHLGWARKATSPREPAPADYGVWSALLGVKERTRVEPLIHSILVSIPKQKIDDSNWPAIDARRQALAQRKAEDQRVKIEKEERKIDRENRKYDKLVRLGLVPPRRSPSDFDLEPLMEQAMEEYGDWRV